jgi:predicted AlkP superfamily pyrophosphatase or phosphodiesterase
VDRLLAEGKLPNVARMAQGGVLAAYSTPAFPSVTASGHAAMWTGCYGDINGITANSLAPLPRKQYTLLESASGFSAEALRAEPLWMTAAKAGKRVVVLSATQSFPPQRWLNELQAAKVAPERFIEFSGFEFTLAEGKVWKGEGLKEATGWEPMPAHTGTAREFTIPIGEQIFYALVYDDPADPRVGFDTVLIREGSKAQSQARASCVLKPGEATDSIKLWSRPFRVTRNELFGNAYFRLFALSPDGKRLALYQREVHSLGSSVASRAEREQYLDAYGDFHDFPFGLYDDGELGAPLWKGGDGTAERRVLELVRLDCAFLTRGTRYALKHWNPDLLFHYTPMSDGAGHTWMGVLDPDSPRYDAALAARLWPFYTQVFQLQDAWLGSVLDQAGKDTVVCLVSDHGMAGVGKLFSPNAFLEKAGLAALRDGKLDLGTTKIAVAPDGDYFLDINGTDRKGGIVPPEAREQVLGAATEALLSATDPETGQHIVTRLFRPEEVVGQGIGGPTGGDLYFDVALGYESTDDYLPGGVRAIESPIGAGAHGFYPSRVKMQAICYLYGAGVRKGAAIPGIRQIDIAPTLAKLLGIPTPKNAMGHVLGDALE